MAASLQSMVQYWKEFDLQELQKELDTTATELANRQDESDASRKRLVDQSREFKKNTPEDVRKLVAPLLKSFQGEVDFLSKRSKAAEAAFLSIYKKLIDLPDPVSVLEYATTIQKKAQRVVDLEIENKQLRDTLDEYNHEFAEVKNQEVTIKQLRDKLKDCEEKIEATAEARTKEKEKELQRLFADKERYLQETQLAVAKKLGEAEQRVTTLHAALENVQSELFEVKAKYDEATTAKSDEMEMVMSELERANERAAGSERQTEQLRQQLVTVNQSQREGDTTQKSADMEKAIDMLQRSGLEVELAAKEKEISQLVDDVQRLQASLNKMRETTASQVAHLEEELTVKNQAFKYLEEKIKTQQDYEEIKRELNVVKSMEFGGSGDEDAKSKSLETLLLEKNRALQSENTTLKVSNSEISGDSSTPALSDNTEAFATMLGEEIAATYQGEQREEQKSPDIRPVSPESPPSPVSSKDTTEAESEEKSSPRPPIETQSSVSTNEALHMPPFPSPFYQFANSHFMANFMGMNLGAIKVDPNNSQGLDTVLVAKTVRELLSIHNIGQRLFAKHVLGLSQGTVSELLSKPKSWDKLTEKGRESYRKMYAWATDERNIVALKAISPKKVNRAVSIPGSNSTYPPMSIPGANNSYPPVLFTGSQPLVSSVQREDAHTEERIAQILNEAQQAMQIKKAMEQQQVAHAMVSSIYKQEMSRLAMMSGHHHPLASPTGTPYSQSDSNLSPTGRRDSESSLRNNINGNGRDSREMVERIYRQELMKLAQAAENAGNMAASSMYQRELQQMARKVHIQEQTEPGEIRRSRSSPDRNSDRNSIKMEPPDSTVEDTLNLSINNNNGPIDLSKHGSSAPTTPTSGGSDKSPSTETAHPSGSAFFIVQPKVNGHPNSFENNQFAPYSAPECVSPLQRMQNIANSLMSRPHMGMAAAKPLRAVLPAITQEQFDSYATINTDDLVKQVKETLSQYSISQRLFGESVLGLSQGSVSDLLARPKPWHMLTQKGREPFIRMQIFLEDTEAIPKLVASQYHIPPEKLMRSASIPKPNEIVSPSDKPTNHVPATSSTIHQAPTEHRPLNQHNIHLHHQHLHPAHQFMNHHPYNWASFSYPSSMLEVVAMTSEIDTLELTSRIKDVLQFHNLGQKLFGEAVLGLSQGSVSELLSKPKPWHMLSIKGREPFIKMHLWLSDPHNVDRLKHYQNEVKAQRRRRSSIDERSYDSSSMPKRPRVFFTEEQKDKLRLAYNQDPYPNQGTIESLASELNVGVKTVINWFHNHRMRAKQQQHIGSMQVGSNFGDGNSSNPNIKSEPNDDISMHSDISSLSDDTNHMSSSFHGNQPNNQWLFPQFEPAVMQKIAQERSREQQNGCSEESGSQSSEKEETKEAQDDLDDEDAPSYPVFNDIDENSNDADQNPSLIEPCQNISPGVNKRKRSNPKYVSEGRELDKTKNNMYGGMLKSCVSKDEGVEMDDDDVEKENELGNVDLNYKAQNGQHLNKIVKLQKAIDSPVQDWDEFDNVSSIEKLKKNLQHSPQTAGTWEF
ncbi:homeobox protein cut-like 1 isoform X2 [Mytilus edulis]|uniref:homeobox protein cut-like 1 isoform X2 n=2 Tax=Mytilus edulis TaxID=6550 RepID=UPI0039EE140C